MLRIYLSQVKLAALQQRPICSELAVDPAVMAALVAVSVALSRLPKDAPARVLRVTHEPDLAERLHDLGFIAGEAVRVVAHALGGDPIAVRVGHSTFALRRAEAAGVIVQPEGHGPP